MISFILFFFRVLQAMLCRIFFSYRHYCLFALLCISVLSTELAGQKLVEVINQTEKAVLVARSFAMGGRQVAEGSGFFISADGVALVPASLFNQGDSVVVELRSGRDYDVSRIVKCHPYANMAMVRVANPKNHVFNYLVPSRESFAENQDVLVYSHPLELDGGFDAMRLGLVKHQFFLKRQALITKGMTERSFGAPVIDTRGQCTGVVNAWDDTRAALVQNIFFMQDSLWYPVNKTPKQMRLNQPLRDRMASDLNEALYFFVLGEYSECARVFSRYLKVFPKDAVAYALRGHARFLYKNNFGSREDFTLVSSLNPNDYLLYYLEGVHLMREKLYADAIESFNKSLTWKPDFAYSLVERGRAQVLLKRDKQAAFNDFDAATKADTTYGAGYYEKARLILQYAENNRSGFNEISRAILLDPSLPGAFTIRGTLYMGLSDYGSANRDFDQALLKDPSDRYALFNRGVALYNMGMSDKACSDWQKAVELGYPKAAEYVSAYCSAKVRKQGR